MSKEKIKKPFYKKWWVWVLAVLIIAAAASGGGEETSKTSSSDTKKAEETKSEPATAATEEKKDEPKKEEKKEFKIGDTVPVGDMTYIISKKEVADQVGPSALPEKASGKFVIIEVTLKNGGNEAVTVDSSFFKLKRGDKTYEADNMASMSANQKEDGSIENSFFLQEVNPDLEVKGFVVFDVAPEVADATDLQLQVQTGIFGTETENINLQ